MTSSFTNLPHFALVTLVAGVYTLLGKLGLSLALVHPSASAVWPPTGFSLAILLLLGRRVWMGIFVGAFFVNLANIGDVPSSFGIAIGNTVEAVVGAWLVERFANGVNAFSNVKNILRFLAGAAVFSTLLSATIGTLSLTVAGQAPWKAFQSIWLTWWMGDMVSNLILAPLIVLWAAKEKPRLNERQWFEAFLLGIIVIVISQLVFGGWFPQSMRTSPLAFLAFPLFLWVGFRFGQRAALTASFLTCAIAVAGTLGGTGPFASDDPNTSLLLLQGFIGVLTITALVISATVVERRIAENLLRDSEERYRSLVVASAQVVWTTNAKGEVIDDLPTWRKFTGQTADQLKGLGWMNALHPDDVPQVAEIWKHSLATKTAHETEFRVQTADGSFRYVFSRAVPVFDGEGQVREWVGTCRDIHERKRGDQNRAILLTLGQRLNRATTAEEAGCIITEAAEKLFGWDACFIYLCDAQQQALFPIINIDTLDGKKKPVPPVYVGSKPSALAQEVLERGAKLILREPPYTFSQDAHAFGDKGRVSASLMFVQVREVEKVVGLFSIQSYAPLAYTAEDLAALQSLADHCGGALQRIRAAEELERIREELARQTIELEKRVAERTIELKDTINSLESFCYTIAHDLRAPLRSLQGFASALSDEYNSQLDSVGQDFCKRIVASAQHMDRLIQDLLAYGQLMHKDLPIDEVNIELVINDALIQLTEEIKNRNAEIEVKQPLPNVFGNTTVLEQVISNLVTNALKFTPAKVAPRICISAEEKEETIRILIRDNGIGIPREHFERIFRVFERLHSASTYPGTGVGLAIVRKGVERMGGKVGLESEVGVGSTFWIELKKVSSENRRSPGQLVQTALNLRVR